MQNTWEETMCIITIELKSLSHYAEGLAECFVAVFDCCVRVYYPKCVGTYHIETILVQIFRKGFQSWNFTFRLSWIAILYAEDYN